MNSSSVLSRLVGLKRAALTAVIQFVISRFPDEDFLALQLMRFLDEDCFALILMRAINIIM